MKFSIYYIDMSVSKIKKLDETQRINNGMTSVISSLVRIWKISYLCPGCSFVWKIRVVNFFGKTVHICNKRQYDTKSYIYLFILGLSIGFPYFTNVVQLLCSSC